MQSEAHPRRTGVCDWKNQLMLVHPPVQSRQCNCESWDRKPLPAWALLATQLRSAASRQEFQALLRAPQGATHCRAPRLKSAHAWQWQAAQLQQQVSGEAPHLILQGCAEESDLRLLGTVLGQQLKPNQMQVRQTWASA